MGTHSQFGSHRVRGDTAFFVRHGYLEVPNLVQWLATLRCGLSCEHCLAVSREAGFSDMPLENVMELIDEIAAMGVREFLVTGGEPLVREDLSEVIEYLGHRQINWTLNTAALPNVALREVIARNRPGFVAVSLDGPKQVHDAFRGRVGAWDEAMEAIRFFKSLDGVTVCAGTTVTTRNCEHLDETFYLVASSGADQWGIHLLVPEGRARERKDLFLSKAQLKQLIRFVARRRQYFPVEMADEIGYLGYLEPLVREAPLLCGAGRSQCVILPDGAVVPCTTLDRSTSAGNLHERPLADIWADGFEALRAWRPTGKCAGCDYAIACKGGCWLQRKAGTQCFKDVWHIPGVLKTAAGVAICLGSLAAPTSQAAPPAPPGPMGIDALSRPCAEQTILDARGELPVYQDLDEAIMNFYIEMAAGLEPGSLTPTWKIVDANDPGGRFFLDFKEGALPEDMTERCAVVCDALETEQRSLSLIALLWRATLGPFFEDNTREHSEAERQTLRDTLALLSATADAWRLEIFEGYLDPYLSDGRYTTPRSSVGKAGPRPGDTVKYALPKDLNEERWGATSDPDSRATEERWQLEREAAEAYFLAYHYADQMDLVFTFYRTGELIKYSGGQAVPITSHIDGRSTGQYTLGIFDVIGTGEEVTLSFLIKGNLCVEPQYDPSEERLLDDDQSPEETVETRINVTLEGGAEYTYVELLEAIYAQRGFTPLTMAYNWLCGDTINLWNRDFDVVTPVYQNGAILWPAFREMIETNGVFRIGDDMRSIEVELLDGDISRAILKETDFWMF